MPNKHGYGTKDTTISAEHAKKYKGFLKLIDKSKVDKADLVLVAEPWVLGDNYEELITNLKLLAEAELSLRICPPERLKKVPQEGGP